MDYTEYTITVRVPDDERDSFLASVSGDDDCSILAAEKAIRAKVEEYSDDLSGVELDVEESVYVRN